MGEHISKAPSATNDSKKVPLQHQSHSGPGQIHKPYSLERIIDGSLAESSMDTFVTILSDRRFSLAANNVTKEQLITRLQSLYGNAYVQHVIQRTQDREERQSAGMLRTAPKKGLPATSQQLSPQMLLADTRVFTSVTEAEERVARPSPEWPALTDTVRSQIQALIQGGQRAQAVQMVWRIVSPSLALQNRVTVELTTEVGVVQGQQISLGRTGYGLCIPYVRRKQNCAGLNQTAHLNNHSPDEINFILQLSTRVFHRPPNEQVAGLLTTLMHEYTHAEEQVARGFLAQEMFAPVIGNREFIYSENVPRLEYGAIFGLDEINACCAEIENAGGTGLANSYEMLNTLNYLWENYRTYYSAVRGNPSAGVVARVRRNIGNGRRMLASFLRTPPGRRILRSVRINIRDLIQQQAPRNFDVSILEPSTAAPAATPSTAPGAPPPFVPSPF